MAEDAAGSEQLALELRVIVRHGLRESALVPKMSSIPGLLSLTCTQPAPAPHLRPTSRLSRLKTVLRAVANSLEGEDLTHGFSILLGLRDQDALRSASDRRSRASFYLTGAQKSAQTFERRHQPKVLSLFADRILDYDATYQARHTHDQMALEAPADPGIAIDWLDRFQYYYRVFADMGGIANDIRAYQARRSLHPDDPLLPTYAKSSLWFFTCVLVQVDRFVQERGGIWMLSDPDVEEQVIASVYLVGWHAPITEADRGYLMFALYDPHPRKRNLYVFDKALTKQERGQTILTRWTNWLAACECEPESPQPECGLHQVQFHCDRYCELIDREWYKIASWYTKAPKMPQHRSVDVTALYQKYDYDLKQFDH